MRPTPLLLAAGVLAAGLITPLSATAASSSYVALGDSYAAGVGTANKVDDCYRSPEGYPRLIANAKGWALSYQACSGATIPQIQANQTGALTASTGYVSVSGGGNDAGFADGLVECAKPGWMSSCTAKLNSAETIINNTIPARLDSLYGVIRSKAPNAKRVAVGYPHLFMGKDCNLISFFSPAEQTRINQLTDKLDNLTAGKAKAYGMTFVDTRPAFTGHAVCDATEWINGVSWPTGESYHPNDAGNRGMATLVTSAFGTPTTFAQPRTASTTRATGADYAALVPDLATEANLTKAERAGLSRGQIKRLDKELRSGDVVRAQKAFTELKRLDQKASKQR